MMKLSVIVLSAALLCACDSSTTTTRVAGGADAGGGGAETGTGTETGSGTGSETGAGTDTGTGTGSGTGTDTGDGSGDAGSSGCVPPVLGTVFTSATPTLLNDGCRDTGGINVSDANLHGTMAVPVLADITASDDPASATDIPQSAKGLYVYTTDNAPAYVVAYTRRDGYFRAGELGIVAGPGIYYVPFERVSPATGGMLDGLKLAVWSMVPGQPVNITEVTWADVADDVTAEAKMHWKPSLNARSQRYPSRHRFTLASSGHPLRQLTHFLSEDIVGQYVALLDGNCGFTPAGHADFSAIQFVDASDELGQAWQGRDVIIGSEDDLTRKVYAIAIDWAYADNSTVASIVSSIDTKDYLWPDSSNPHINLAADCHGQLNSSLDYDAMRSTAAADNTGWLH